MSEHGATLGWLWAIRWTLITALAHLAGIVVNALLLGANAFGVASANHVDNTAGNLWHNYVLQQVGSLGLFAVPLAVALLVLWFAGPRLGDAGFRALSLVLFLGITPCTVVYWSAEFSLWTWLVAQLAVALRVRSPEPGRSAL